MKTQAAVAAVTVLTGGLVAGTQTAVAAPERASATCSFMVPAKLVLNAPSVYVGFPVGRDCPKTIVDANWQAQPIIDHNYTVGCAANKTPSTAFCYLSVQYTPIGVLTRWVPQGYGWDAKGHKVADLKPATSTTKCGAAIGLTGVRQGTKTTVYARASYYSTKSKAFTRHHGRVLFQKRDVGSNTWTDLGWAYPNTKTGAASYTITTNRSRDYRVYVPSSSTVWYAYSATKRV